MPYRIDPNTGQPVWDGTSIPQASRDSLSTQIRELQAQIDALSFIDLDDAPTTYTGQSGKILSVKSTEDGLEFVTNSGGGGGVTDGDKGDVIVSSSGSVWTLDTSGVTAGSYTLASITVDAKGRVTAASSGSAQTITLTGDVTGAGTGTFATTLANSGVTAGSYTLASVTVDAKGRITSASNGTVSASTISDSTTVGQNILKLTNPGAVTFLQMNADNTVSALSASSMLSALGGYAASNPSGYTTNTGTVTSVSVTTANGISGTVATATSTPAITLSLGAITPSSVNGITLTNGGSGALTVTGTAGISGSNTGDVTINAISVGYLTRSGQDLTAAAINLGSHVTGTLPFANIVNASAASRLVGRGSASGAGVFQEITLGSGLSMSGTTLSSTGGSFDPASPGAIGGTTPSTAVFTQLDVRTELDIQSTTGAAGPILVWRTGTDTPTDWERASLAWSSTTFTLSTQQNGSGVAREVEISPGGISCARFTTDGRIRVNSATLTTGNIFSVKSSSTVGTYATIRVESRTSTASTVEIGTTGGGNGFITILSGSGNIDLQAGTSYFPGNLNAGQTSGNAARMHIKGSGTTSSTTALRVDNSSGTARFIVRDDGAFAFGAVTPTVVDTGWTDFTNLTTDRTCDANATTVEELADILGTLIVALKNKGILAN